jgi:hypothetical protein
MSSTTSSPSSLSDNFDVDIPQPPRHHFETDSAPAAIPVAVLDHVDDDDDDELSDEAVARLLREAEERMKNGNSSSALSKATTDSSIASIK